MFIAQTTLNSIEPLRHQTLISRAYISHQTTHGPLQFAAPPTPPATTATMPPTPLIHRPQTLKQAKKAYRKAGATVRLSESEKAVLERRAVLQERADRIKEREARRKANVKRKEERVQKEREARHRMGIPTPPAKEGIQVGPSQLHLSDFVYAGVKRKMDDGEEEEKSEIEKEGDLVVQEQQTSPMEPLPSRQPLRPVSANANCQRLTLSQSVMENSPKVRDFALEEISVSPKRIPVPSKTPLFHSNKGMREDEVPEPLRSVLLKAQRMPESQKRMGMPNPLPPLCRPPESKANGSTSQRKPPENIESRYTSTSKAAPNQIEKAPCIPSPKPESVPEDCFDDFFVSNTQIQRELSPPPTPPAKNTPFAVSIAQPPTPAPLSKPPATNENTADLLALISTQDLDFSDELTQRPSLAQHDEPDLDEDFPDDELEDIVLEFELESPIKSSNATSPESQQPNPNPSPQSVGERYYASSDGSHYDSDSADDAEIQAGLQQVFKDKDHEKERLCQEAQRAAAECDAFDLSTQDLMELES